MRILAMHKVDASMEAGAPVSKDVIDGMGAFVGELMRTGVFIDGAGLRPSGTRLRLFFNDGERVIERGPFTGSNELVASLCLMSVKDEAAAIEVATRFAHALGGNVELELGPITENWDLGFGTRPPDAPYRALLLNKANAASESGAPLSPKRAETVDALVAELRAEGVVSFSQRLTPGAKAKRVTIRGGTRSVVDGPFAESKELIAGFSLLELPSMDDAVEWTERFAAILGGTQVDLRPLPSP